MRCSVSVLTRTLIVVNYLGLLFQFLCRKFYIVSDTLFKIGSRIRCAFMHQKLTLIDVSVKKMYPTD